MTSDEKHHFGNYKQETHLKEGESQVHDAACLSREHLKLSKGNTAFFPLQHRNRELHYRNAEEFIPSLYRDQHPGSGHHNTWGLKEAKPSIMAPTGGAKAGLQVWETLPVTRGGFSVIAPHVKASSSVFWSKRINTRTVYKPFWAIITSETKVTSQKSGVLMNYKEAFSWFSCEGFHNSTVGIKVTFRK